MLGLRLVIIPQVIFHADADHQVADLRAVLPDELERVRVATEVFGNGDVENARALVRFHHVGVTLRLLDTPAKRVGIARGKHVVRRGLRVILRVAKPVAVVGHRQIPVPFRRRDPVGGGGNAQHHPFRVPFKINLRPRAVIREKPAHRDFEHEQADCAGDRQQQEFSGITLHPLAQQALAGSRG